MGNIKISLVLQIPDSQSGWNASGPPACSTIQLTQHPWVDSHYAKHSTTEMHFWKGENLVNSSMVIRLLRY